MDSANQYPKEVNIFCNFLRKRQSAFWEWLRAEGPKGRILDFKQDLSEALCKAEESYDPAKGASFMTHAFWKFRTIYRRYARRRAKDRQVSLDRFQETPSGDDKKRLDVPDENADDPSETVADLELTPWDQAGLTLHKRWVFKQLHDHWRRRREGGEDRSERIVLSPPQGLDAPWPSPSRPTEPNVWLARRAWWRFIRL
jgi:hypothetical protein